MQSYWNVKCVKNLDLLAKFFNTITERIWIKLKINPWKLIFMKIKTFEIHKLFQQQINIDIDHFRSSFNIVNFNLINYKNDVNRLFSTIIDWTNLAIWDSRMKKDHEDNISNNFEMKIKCSLQESQPSSFETLQVGRISIFLQT